jgi:hypothetical protein
MTTLLLFPAPRAMPEWATSIIFVRKSISGLRIGGIVVVPDISSVYAWMRSGDV